MFFFITMPTRSWSLMEFAYVRLFAMFCSCVVAITSIKGFESFVILVGALMICLKPFT